MAILTVDRLLMLSQHLSHLDSKKPFLLQNKSCPYCNKVFEATGTKEHVIGRRFVPRGTLDGSWNLILRACLECNARKADLEDDLSALTMQPDSAGQYVRNDEILVAEASRKQGSISRKTGKSVGLSAERVTLRAEGPGGAKFIFEAVAQPQVGEERAFELARMQLMAFFYWITFNAETGRGGFWLGQFLPLHAAFRADWGNPIHRAFMETVLSWEPRVFAEVAAGYFKVIIRRHPTAVLWSWALEWNDNYRLIGFFGEPEPAQDIATTFPRLDIASLLEDRSSGFGYRMDTPLPDELDTLYSYDRGALGR